MKHFRFFTVVFCMFSCLVSSLLIYFLCLYLSIDIYNPLIWCLFFTNYIVVHDYICRYVVCAVRKKYNITDGCYFWNCPHYSVCPNNSDK